MQDKPVPIEVETVEDSQLVHCNEPPTMTAKGHLGELHSSPSGSQTHSGVANFQKKPTQTLSMACGNSQATLYLLSIPTHLCG